MVAMARALLDNPRWVWHAAEHFGVKIDYPPQYARVHSSLWPGAKLARPQADAGVIFFEPENRDRKLFPLDPFKGVVVPRPIGWISSMSKAGQLNLAPYSFFNGVQSRPRIVSFCSETEKDAAAFAIESGEFAWSMATWDAARQDERHLRGPAARPERIRVRRARHRALPPGRARRASPIRPRRWSAR